MFPIGTVREYVDEDVFGILCDYIRRGENSDDPAERLNWEIQKPRLEYYIKNNRRTLHKVDENRVRRLSYDMIPELLRIAELDGKAFFELLGVSVPSAGTDFERLGFMLDRLPRDTVERIKQSAFTLSADWWRSEEISSLQPTLRIHRTLERVTTKSERAYSLPEELTESWHDQHGNTTVSIRSLPKVAAYLGISLHWLMRLPPDIGLYGENFGTDVIIDAYSFMSKETRLQFLRAVITTYRDEVEKRGSASEESLYVGT